MNQIVLTPQTDDRRPLEPIKPAEGYDHGRWNAVFTKPGEFDRIAEASHMRVGQDASTDEGDFPYRMAMATYISEYRGMPFEESLSVFDEEKERWAKATLNKPQATAKEMFDWTAEQFREQNKKQEAYDGVLQNVIRRSVEDALSGEDRPWMASIQPDLEATKGVLDDDEREDLLQKAQEIDIEKRRAQWAVQDDARLLFRELQKSTGQVQPAEGEKTLSMGELAERFAAMPDERRKAIYNLVGAFGGLQGVTKGDWYQFAENLASSLGRGANVYYEGIPRNLSEDGLMDLKAEIERTPELVVTDTETPFPVGLKSLNGGVFQPPSDPANSFNELGAQVATMLPQFTSRTRKATDEEKQKMLAGINQALAVLKVKREIKSLAENGVDPIRNVTNLPGWLEQGLYGAIGSAPYTVAAMIPVFGGPTVYAAIYSQQKDDWINAGMPIERARPLALTLAIPSAAIEEFQATALKRALPSFAGLVKSMTDPTRGSFYRWATQSVLLNAEQAGQEYAQDSLSWFWQLAGSAIYEDVQRPTLPSASELTESALTTFVATFTMSLFSVGAIGFREVKRGRAAIQNKAALEQRGYSESQINRVLQAESEQEVRQVIQEEDQKRDPELVAKAAETILAKARDAGKLADVSNLGLPTVVRMEDGKYLVTGNNGEIIVEDADGLTAANIVDNALYRQLMQFAAVQKGLIDALVEAAGKDGIEVEFSVEEQKALDEMAGLTPEALAVRVAAWEAEHKASAEGLSFVTMGLNNVQRVKEGLYRSINRVAQATRPEAVMAALEEHAEGIFKIALAQGDFTRDEAAQWLKEYTAETQDVLLSENFDSLDDDAKLRDLTEAMSSMSVAYFTGNVNRSRLNPKLRAFFERVAELMRAVVARAIKIKQAQAAGAIGADFEGFLARSVGLDFDQIVEARAFSAAEDFAGVERQTASIAPIVTAADEGAAMEDAVKDFERELSKPQQERLRRVAAKQFAVVEAANAEVLRAHDEEGKPLPAPNGKPSKLNRHQWVQVRTPLFKRWFGDWEALARGENVNPDSVSKAVDAETGEPKPFFHGSKRADRIGSRFLRTRATSGPMAFWSDDAEVSSNYATGKEDTSLEHPDDYAGWFKYKAKGMRAPVDIATAWYHLSSEQRKTVLERIYTVGYQNADEAEGPIVADSKSITGDGHIDSLLRESRGNGLRALVELWLNSGELFNKEREFVDVLAGVGLDANVTFDDPNAMRSGVFPGWLSIRNPLVVQNIPGNVVDSLQEASKRKRAKRPSGGNHDVWDKNLRSGREWIAALKMDLQRDNADFSTAFTSIPDWVTETLEGLGYDGIFDVGGKLGGKKHTVAIPFVSNQIKSATGNEGMFSGSGNITLSIAPAQFADLESALLALDKDPVLRRERVALTLRRVKEIRQEFDEAREASQAQSEDQSWLESKLAEEKASAIADLNAEEEKEVLASKRRNAEKFALRAEKLDEADPKIKRLERESAKEGRQIERAAKAKFNERRKAVEADYNTRIADAQREAVARAKDSAKNDPMHFVEAIAHMEAIINMLPPEARANVGGYKRLASLKTADARVKYLQDRIAKVDEAMEGYLRKEFTKQIETLIEKAKPKLKPNKDLTGNLGGDVHQYVAKVEEAIHMTADQMSARMQAADIAITEADDSADISDLLQEWWILNTFGDLYTRDALHLDMARQELAEVIATGRRQWRMIEEARRDMYEKESDALAKDLKKKGKFTDPHVKTGDIIKQFFDGHLSLMQFLNRFTETPFLHRLKRRLAWAEQDIDIARSKHALALSDTIKKAIGPNASKADADRALHDLKTKLYAIEYQEGGKITKRRLSIDKAQEIIAGKGDLKALNLTAEDIAAIREQLKDAAKTKNKQRKSKRKSITWESKASTEKATKEVTRGQAIFLLMSWAQPDVREKMERGGWTEGDMTELAKITKDDVSRAIMGFLRETYQEMGDRAGEVFQRIFGAPMPRPFNYAPTRWENAQSLSDLSPLGDVIEASGITPGAVKTRQNHNADVRTVDAVDVFFQHIAQMEHWIAMAEINRDLRGVLLSKKVRQGIEATYGKPYLQAFERNVDAVMRGGALKAAELMADVRFISNIIAGKSVATLGFNMRTVFSQVDAFSRGAFAIPAKEYFKRLIDPNIWQKVPDAWKSETIQRRVIAGSNPQVRFVYDAGKVNPSTLLRLGAYSFQPMQYTDAYLTSVTAAIVYDYHYTESLKAGATEQMAKKFAEEEMMFAVYNFSQPIDRANRSSREISGNIFMRGYMMFMSDARLKTALMYEAVRNIAEGKGTSKDYRWIATIFAMALLTQASRNIFSGIFRPGDDDDDVWGSYARALMTAPFEGFLGMNTGVNALANVATGKKAYFGGKDPISNQFEIWHSASKDIGDVFQVDDIEAFLKEADKLTKAAAVHPTIATPAAVMNAVKDAKGLYDNLTKED